MHEMRFAHEIVGAVKKVVEKQKTEKKRRQMTINLRLSPLSHVTAETLRGTATALLLADGLPVPRFDVAKEPFTLRCNICKDLSMHTEAVVACPSCGNSDFEIEIGREFYVDSICEK